VNFWRRWVAHNTYRGRWREMVNRSALTLKLLTSRQYGSKTNSVSACWTTEISGPCKLRWAIIPVCAGDDLHARINVIKKYREAVM